MVNLQSYHITLVSGIISFSVFSTIPFAARVFEEAGWLGRDAVLMTGINAIIYVLSTLPPYVLI